MQDPNLVNRPVDVNRPLDDIPPRPVEERTTVVTERSGGTGGWAVAVILAVLVAVGIFYFSTGTPGDGVDPNANTSSIETQDTAPAGGQTGAQPMEVQPAEGGGATTTTP